MDELREILLADCGVAAAYVQQCYVSCSPLPLPHDTSLTVQTRSSLPCQTQFTPLQSSILFTPFTSTCTFSHSFHTPFILLSHLSHPPLTTPSHPSYTSHTPLTLLSHSFHASLTTLSHTFLTVTPLSHPSYTPPTLLSHLSHTPFTPLSHTPLTLLSQALSGIKIRAADWRAAVNCPTIAEHQNSTLATGCPQDVVPWTIV